MPPGVAANQATVTAAEGQAAGNAGTWSDHPGENGTVTLSASLGTVTQKADGTWTWSYTPLDGPASSTVTITANDGAGGVSTASFTLTVTNTAPTLAVGGAGIVMDGLPYTLNLSASDPGTDTISAWTINWGDGLIESVPGNPAAVTHTYPAGAQIYTVSATATDEDGTHAAANTHEVRVISAGAELVDGVLYIVGTAGADSVSVKATASQGVAQWQVSAKFLPGGKQLFPADLVTALQFALGEGNDTLKIPSQLTRPVVVYGGGGNDKITAGGGPLTAYGGAGNDKLTGGVAQDVLFGELGDDTLTGNAGNDQLDGGLGNDRLYGKDGDDTLLGGGGLDQLWGGNGNDQLDGGADDDKLKGDAGDDGYGGPGNDQLWGGTGNDQLHGDEGNDVLKGDAGNDLLWGEDGDDRLAGGAGADELRGGPGTDDLNSDKDNTVMEQAPLPAASPARQSRRKQPKRTPSSGHHADGRARRRRHQRRRPGHAARHAAPGEPLERRRGHSRPIVADPRRPEPRRPDHPGRCVDHRQPAEPAVIRRGPRRPAGQPVAGPGPGNRPGSRRLPPGRRRVVRRIRRLGDRAIHGPLTES